MLVLIAHLLILEAGPRGPAEFDQAIYVPRLDRATEFNDFLRAGGSRTVLLRSENWRETTHPLLRFDITRPDTAVEAGLDVTQALTLVFKGDLEVSCTTIKDLQKFTEYCFDRMKVYGVPWKDKVDGVTLIGVKDTLGRVPTGYAIKGLEACAARDQGRSVEASLKDIAKWLLKPPTGPSWKLVSQVKGAAYFLSPTGIVALNAEGLTTVADARGDLKRVGLAPAGESPYAAYPGGGLLVLKAQGDPQALPGALEEVALRIAAMCPSCTMQPFKAAAHALAPTLTGNAMALVAKIKVVGSLRTEGGRFFALRGAILAESKDVAASKAVLATLAVLKGAKPLDSGEGFSLILREGELRIGVRGNNVYMATDVAVLDGLLKGLPATPAKQSHSAEWSVDPKLLSQGLSQVPLLDAVQSGELAGVLAAGAELGPLLLGTTRITGWADPMSGTSYKAQLSWTLKPMDTPDAGVSAPSDGG